MAVSVTVTSAEYLDAINDIIHDQFFDIADVVWDSTANTLTIPFIYSRDRGLGHFFRRIVPERCGSEARLCVDEVSRYDLVDTEQVGTYDFNVVRYRPEKCKILILTGIPLGFEITVQRLHIRLEVD